MLHRLRETRTLSLIYLCSLSLFLFSASLWWVLTTELAFQGHLLDRATSTLAGLAIQVVLPGLSLVALFVVALATLTHALTHRQGGTLLFAILCLGLGIVGGFGDRPWFGLDVHFPLLVLVLGWLPVGIIALCVGVGLFVTGVKGLQAIRKGRWWPLAFALAIDLLLPASLTSYALWGRQIITSGQFPPGGFFVGNMFFVSLANFLSFLLLELAPYLLLGALLLALVSNESSTRSWRVTRRFGVAFTLVLVVTLAAVLVFDVNLWLRGGVRIFDPTHGVWPLFGGQWIGPLLTDVVVLVVALSLALLALIYSFLIQSGEEPSAQQLAS